MKLLEDMWTLLRGSPGKIDSYRGKLPKTYLIGGDSEPFRVAVASLTRAELRRLQEGLRVPVAENLFESQIAAYDTGWRQAAQRFRDQALGTGYPDPYPDGVPERPSHPASLLLKRDDYDGEHPERLTMYGLYLSGVQLVEEGDRHLVFHPMEDEGPEPLTSLPGEVVVDFKDSTLSQHDLGDMATVVAALARKARINLYQEHFYKPVYWGARSRGIRMTRGRVSEVINEICREWKYVAQRVGSDYVMWSRTWASDRAVDIADEVVNAWRSKIDRVQGPTIEQRIELARTLSFPQLRITLDLLLPEAGPWSLLRTYRVLSFIGSFAEADRRVLGLESGVPLTRLSPAQFNVLVHQVVKPPATLAPEVFRRFALRMVNPSPNRLQLQLLAPNGRVVWSVTEVFVTPQLQGSIE